MPCSMWMERLEVNGTLEEPVWFQGDRLEEFYEDIPGQWRFIYLSENSHGNVIDHAEIICGTMGVLISASPESGTAARPEDQQYH